MSEEKVSHAQRHIDQVEFIENGLREMLTDEVCGDCKADSCDDSDCPGDCIGSEVLLELDEQIAAEAVALAKQIAGEWIRDSIE